MRLEGGGAERIALFDVAGLVAAGEPALALLAGTVRPAFGGNPSRGGLLDPVVTHGRSSRERIVDILLGERFQVGLAGGRVRSAGRVLGPQPCVAVSLQLRPDGAGL